MADECKRYDVAIVGSGVAGALIAKYLAARGKKVVILEAGAKIPPNINDYMERFFTATFKVPESPYTPALFSPEDSTLLSKLADPGTVNAGRPTVLSLSPDKWKDPKKSYLVQGQKDGDQPFASTYERVAGGTSTHWLGTSLRFSVKDFKMKSSYGQFVDWPIGYNDLDRWYGQAERELGVAADVRDQAGLGIPYAAGYAYPMPRIPPSLVDAAVADALAKLTEAERTALGMDDPKKPIRVISTPAARNSQPYGMRRACAGNTNCIPICPIQAKYDPTITLNEALDTGNVEFLDRAVASEVVVGPNGRVSQINYIRYEKDFKAPGQTTATGCVTATVFVIAANSIETPRLLLMSKIGDREGAVANSSGLVGKNLMDHPYYVVWGLMPPDRPVYPYRGPLSTSGIEDLRDGKFRRERGAFRVDIGNEGWNFVVGGFGGDPNVTTSDFVNGTNASGLNTREITGLDRDNAALFGPQLAQTLNNLISRQIRLGFLVEQAPETSNSVTLSDPSITDGLGLRRPQISYRISDYTRKGIIQSRKLANLIFAKMGAKQFTKVLPDDPTRFEADIDGERVLLNFMGAGHLMGTHRMGANAKDSVVDSFQRSWDHKNLFLVGSGTFPTTGTANPTLTIAALSLRTADRILREDLK
jgi:choline dehydrogenase-like flavoprotein